jgi:hypothetical protein
VLGALAAAGCSEFATPAELEKTTIIAVVADPPAVAPGGTSTLSVVVAGPTGLVAPDSTLWSIVGAYPGVAPLGQVTVTGEGATYTAPQDLPQTPTGVETTAGMVRVDVRAGGASLAALKAVLVQSEPRDNPRFAHLLARGTPVPAGQEIVAPRGEPVDLDLAISPGLDDDSRVAWYATLGAIEQYQSSPTTWMGDQAGQGTLFVVVRDGLGGTAWHSAPLRIE